ncbi:PDZ domain-containing protein [soil metagenome]
MSHSLLPSFFKIETSLMWHYEIASIHPESRFLNITFKIDIDPASFTEVALPAWRPGRYELGNFAKNIRNWCVYDQHGLPLSFTKINKDTWKIQTDGVSQIEVRYEYYAAQADAGACWVDKDLMYVNPVHCLMYLPGNLHVPCSLRVVVPDDWQIACSMQSKEKHILLAEDFHELVDSPFFAAKALHHRTYSVNDYEFHVWLHGNVKPDWDLILKDFKAFTEIQLSMMHSFPVAEYHFLVLILPYRFYHGVEHIKSTVLALGPDYQFMHKELYADFLGVASHELFHAWNVKTLRPDDFVIYDYSRENYSQLGWVYEGFTTYYGDLFLARSGFFDQTNYFAEINARLQKHFDSNGRFNYSVAESSFDTWLDGYVPGVPHRKTSIYDEGSLFALMLDLYLRRSSAGKNSLDTLFIRLYQDFAPLKKGYREQDVKLLAIKLSDGGVEKLFDRWIHQRISYESDLQELLNYVGCYLQRKGAAQVHEKLFGFRVATEGGVLKVASVIPGSPAEFAGLSKDDEVIACNGRKVEQNLNDLMSREKNEVILSVFTQRELRNIILKSDGKTYFDQVTIATIAEANEQQMQAFTSWTGLKMKL